VDTGGLSWGVNLLGLATDHSPPSGVKVKKKVQLYFYSSSVTSWPVPG
jgi:hypothetical protein